MRNHAASFVGIVSMSAFALAGCSGSPTEELGVPDRPLADEVSEAREELTTISSLCSEFSVDANTVTSPQTVSATGFCLNYHLKHPGSLPYIYVLVTFPNLAGNSAACAAASVRLRVHHKTSTAWPILLDTTVHGQNAAGKCMASTDRFVSNPGGELWANIITSPRDSNEIKSQWMWGP